MNQGPSHHSGIHHWIKPKKKLISPQNTSVESPLRKTLDPTIYELTLANSSIPDSHQRQYLYELVCRALTVMSKRAERRGYNVRTTDEFLNFIGTYRCEEQYKYSKPCIVDPVFSASVRQWIDNKILSLKREYPDYFPDNKQ